MKSAWGYWSTSTAATLALSALLTGCSSVSSNTTPVPQGEYATSAQAVDASTGDADIESYANQMKKLAVREEKLLKRYASVTGDRYKDDATTYEVLYGLLPDVSEFIGDLEAVIPPPGPIAEAHEVYVDAWNTQAEGMILVTSAIEQQNLELIAQGNEKLADGRARMREAQALMSAALQ